MWYLQILLNLLFKSIILNLHKVTFTMYSSMSFDQMYNVTFITINVKNSSITPQNSLMPLLCNQHLLPTLKPWQPLTCSPYL